MSENQPIEIKFIADRNLIKLAKWLRLLGFDVKISLNSSIQELLRIKFAENRIILTRNTSILKQKHITDIYLIIDNDPMIQLQRLAKIFPINPIPLFKRCTECNGLIETLPRTEAIKHVPSITYMTNCYFWQCSDCKRIYWCGSHISLAINFFQQLLG
jgi:uncharacterized protein